MNSPEEKNTLHDFFLHSWHPYAWLLLIAFLLYARVLAFTEYTHYDDYYLIVDNYVHIKSFSSLGHAFLEDVSHQGQGGNLYRPLLTISFMLSAQLSGTLPFGYHLLDIILHAASCCLLFSALQALGFRKKSAFYGTLLFCVHPVLTQAVAWIAGRNDSLLAVFILLGFMSVNNFLSTHRMKWYILHLLCFACAMFTKESAILFPLMMIVYSWVVRKDKILSMITALLIVGWIVILVNWQIVRSAAMVVPVGTVQQSATAILSNLPLAVYYLGKIFWPFDLAFAPVLRDAHSTAGILSLAVLGVAVLFSERREWSMILFGALWFLVFLLPTFYYNISVQAASKFYEHRIYIPFMGIIFLLLSLSYQKRMQSLKGAVAVATILMVCVLGFLSYRHTSDYTNSLTLGEYDAATSPNDPGPYKEITRMTMPPALTAALRAQSGSLPAGEGDQLRVTKEDLWQIINHLQVQLNAHPQDPTLLHALAVAEFARGLASSSEKNFLAAFHRTPTDAVIPYNLGILYYSAHDVKKAEQAWEQALELDPSMGKAHLNLTYLFYESGRYAAAWNHCQQARRQGMEIPSRLSEDIRNHGL